MRSLSSIVLTLTLEAADKALAAPPAASPPHRPTWLETLDVLRWPTVALLGIAVAVSPLGRKLFQPFIERITQVSAGFFKIDFSEKQAPRAREDFAQWNSQNRSRVMKEFDGLAHTCNIEFFRNEVVNEYVVHHLSSDAKHTFRCTLHVEDLLFRDALYQLLDYAPEGSGRGRIFSTRLGIIGRAWRSASHQAEPSVPLDPEKLVLEWGMTKMEALATGRGRKSFLCSVLKSERGEPLGIFYVDAMQEEAFGTKENGLGVCAEIEAQSATLGLTSALTTLVEETRKRGPQFDIYPRG